MTDSTPAEIRTKIREKYSDVAEDPKRQTFFPTGRTHAMRLGYDPRMLRGLPDHAVESFCGVANPFALRRLEQGERIVDLGCGAGLDCLIAARQVGPSGAVLGVDMTEAMVAKARTIAEDLGFAQVRFRCGLAERLPASTGWADAIISNGVFNLCVDKRAAIVEARRCLRPGGYLQFADVSFPSSSRGADDTQGFLSVERWVALLDDAGFAGVEVGQPIDTFAGAPAPEGTFEVFGYPFVARRAG